MSAPPAHLVVFYCDGGSLATPPAEPVLPGVGFVRVPCIGRVATGQILRPLRLGAAGVLLCGCEPDACRFLRGLDLAEQAVTRASLALGTLGLDPSRVGLARVGRGQALLAAVESFLAELGGRPVARAVDDPYIDAFPSAALWPHHGVVQEAAALSGRPDATPALVPIWAEAAPVRIGAADTLLYACDLPVLADVLGEPFGVRTLETLEAAVRLGRHTGETIGIWPGPSCGHDFALAGLTTPFVAAANRFRRALRETGAARLVVVAPECGFTLTNIYPTLGVSIGVEVVSLAAWLHAHREALPLGQVDGDEPGVALLVEGPPSALPDRRRRALDLLARAGVEPVIVLPDHRRAQPARGSAGVNGFVRCDQAARNAQDQLLRRAERAGAGVLLTTSTHASVHLGCALRRGGWRRARIRVTTLFDFLAERLPDADGAVGT